MESTAVVLLEAVVPEPSREEEKKADHFKSYTNGVTNLPCVVHFCF